MTKFRRPKIYIIMKMCHYSRGLLAFAAKRADFTLMKSLRSVEIIGNF
jgi:hypothetical protein